MNMKGITPVIAIILLLLITISMVGFAYVWFNRVLTSTTEKTSEQLGSQLDQQAKTVRIDNIAVASGTISSVSLRNTGSVNIVLATDITLYANNVLKTCTWDVASLAPSAVATCTLPASTACAPGQVVKVTAPGGQDAGTC